MSNNEIFIQLLETFRVEAAELFDELAHSVGELSSDDVGAVRRAAQAALRLAHNLKGSSGAVGLDMLSHLAHRVEDALVPLSRTGAAPEPATVALLQSAVVLAQQLVERTDAPELLAEVERISADLETAQDLGSRELSTPSREVGSTVSPHGSQVPPAAGVRSRRPPPPFAPRDTTTAYIKVPTQRLDVLAGHLDELLSVHEQLRAQHQKLVDMVRLADEEREAIDPSALRRLSETQRRGHVALSRLTSDLVDTLQKVRTVPLETVAHQWRRVVRDAAQSLAKSVELKVDVGDTELDKHVLDQLRDAIVHLLRNAVGHGIEERAERHLLGKSNTGTIALVARLAGASVRIEISDDGRGLEPDEVATSAAKRGLLAAEQVEHLSAAEKLDLLFRDGFSTAEGVTTLSGRGVGLAAVRESVARLGGRYSVTSEGYGRGTTFSLQVPISVLASRGLFVRVDGVVYMLPIDTVEQALRIRSSDICSVDGTPALLRPGSSPLPLTWLDGRANARLRKDERFDVVVLTFGVDRAGLVVDKVLDEQECVTRRLPWNLHRVPGVSGVVMMPDGSVAMALDVQHLLGDVGRGNAQALAGGEPALPGKRPTTILVVDDSLTSRTLARNILAAAGYEVAVAVDGKDAWQQLQQRSFDLLVSDVEMPNMDGLELTRHVRGHTQLNRLPVVLVTSRGRQSDVELGAAAGADEYLVKGQFDHDKLLRAVERHLFPG